MNTVEEMDMKLNTSGRGLWSTVKKTVRVIRMELDYCDDDWGMLRVYFNTDDWNVPTDGLIYTDPQWLDEFRGALANCGYSISAAEDVNYSEQGMQGVDYVSLDAGPDFVAEFSAKF